MKENKKIVKVVSKIVSGGAKEYSVLKNKGEKIAKDLKKKWADSEPKRKIIEAKTKKTMKKMGKEGKSMIDKSVQFGRDVRKGIKSGLK